MSALPLLRKAPIVEAVIDIDCDLPPVFSLEAVEAGAREAFRAQYPKLEKRYVGQVRIETGPEIPTTGISQAGLDGLLFRNSDGTQIVQIRAHGYSFNRLAPYSTLDDYLPEVERTWAAYRTLAGPLLAKGVRLRYINRIELPLQSGEVKLGEYFTGTPHPPAAEQYSLTGFVSHMAIQHKRTGHRAHWTLTAQDAEAGHQPVVLDIEVGSNEKFEPEDWGEAMRHLAALRRLKNELFEGTITPLCRELFR